MSEHNKSMSRRLRVARRLGRDARRGVQVSLVALLVPAALGQSGQASGQLSTQDRQRTDAGTITESQKRADERPRVSRADGKTVVRANAPKTNNSMAGVRMSVKGFRFEGNVGGVSGEAIDKVLAPWKDRDLSFAEYEQAVHAVAKFLRDNGHPNAQVMVSRAQIKDNTIAVAIQGLNPGTVVAAPLDAKDAASPLADATPRVFVRQFRVSGTDAITQAEADRAAAAYVDRPLTLKEMDEATAAIATAVRAKGLGLAQAFMPPQKIQDGLVDVTVQPGVVDAASGRNGITVTGAGQIVKTELVEKVIAQGVKAGEPLNTNDLEVALRIAGDLPGIKSVKAELTPGAQPGSTQVQARVEESRRIAGTVWADNHGSPYVGTNRMSGQFNLNSPTGNGEQYNAQFTTSTGVKSFKVGGSALLTPTGARAGAAFSRMNMEIGSNLAPLSLNSQSTVKSLFGSYPLVRSATANVTLEGNLDAKEFVNNLAGTRDNDRRVNVLTGGLSGDLLDRFNGQTVWSVQAASGKVDLSRAPLYELVDAVTAQTQGNFFKLNVNVARQVPLTGSFGNRWSLYTAISGQTSGKNLDSGEKFQLGGPTGVRGYPVGEGLGDRGWLATAELRYNIPTPGDYTSQFFTFVDTGGLRQYNNLWAGAIPAGRPNGYTLTSVGAGISVTRTELGSVRIMYAHKVGNNPNPTITGTDSDGLNKGGRVWIFGTVSF